MNYSIDTGKLENLLRHFYTLLAVTVAFVVFRADTISEAFLYIAQMFSGFDFSPAAMSFAIQSLSPYFVAMLLAAILCCGPLRKLSAGISNLETKPSLTVVQHIIQGMSFVLAFVLFAWCIVRLAGGSYNPFIYFRF